jgi:hypothetical protein
MCSVRLQDTEGAVHFRADNLAKEMCAQQTERVSTWHAHTTTQFKRRVAPRARGGNNPHRVQLVVVMVARSFGTARLVHRQRREKENAPMVDGGTLPPCTTWRCFAGLLSAPTWVHSSSDGGASVGITTPMSPQFKDTAAASSDLCGELTQPDRPKLAKTTKPVSDTQVGALVSSTSIAVHDGTR